MEKRRKGRRVALVVGAAVLATLLAIGLLCRHEIRAWYVFLMRFERLPDNEQGYPEYRDRQTGIVFVFVPGGEFDMGTSDEEGERWNAAAKQFSLFGLGARVTLAEEPVHKVSVRPFLVAKYEVTQAAWERAMGVNPSQFSRAELPVERVSWLDCQEFCKKTGLSIPTEAHWEFACRAGTSSAFTFGPSVTAKQVRFCDPPPYSPGAVPYRTVPVDSFEPNGFGLYNMHGNVMEWCQDVYDKDFYRKPESRGLDPVARSGDESRRVARGGSALMRSMGCRSATRVGLPAAEAHPVVGFRPYVPMP